MILHSWLKSMGIFLRHIFYIFDVRESSIGPIELIFGDDDGRWLYFEYQNWKKNFDTIYLADQDLKQFSVVGQTSPFLVETTKVCILGICTTRIFPKSLYILKFFFLTRKYSN